MNMHSIDGVSGNTVSLFGWWQGRMGFEISGAKSYGTGGWVGSKITDFLVGSFLNGFYLNQ